MNFGEILDTWEKQNAGDRAYRDAAAFKETGPGRGKLTGERRSRLLRKKPDAEIDLHGLNREDAWMALESFFENSRAWDFEKVLIIHGKGNHGTDGVLRGLVKRFIESCPYAGESGFNPTRKGGTGSTWVILKGTNARGK